MALCCCALVVRGQDRFVVLEYNVENLFDCRHDSLKKDMEFLPESIRGWNFFRFNEKINKLAKVIYAAGEEYVPDLVGLCEVENDFCLRSLVDFSPLKEVGYRYVMTDSPDERGIDVALMYQPFRFRLIESECIRVDYPEATRPTRDILHVAGRTLAGGIIDVFVCHMPSRMGGKRASEPYRLFAARVLRKRIDEILSTRSKPQIIVMGDFNDGPEDRALAEVLQAGRCDTDAVEYRKLYNMMYYEAVGSYKYKNRWETIDHMIVNGQLLDKGNALHTSKDDVYVLRLPFLLEEDEKYGGMKPFRTYNGMRYQNGYSDHLPVKMVLKTARER